MNAVRPGSGPETGRKFMRVLCGVVLILMSKTLLWPPPPDPWRINLVADRAPFRKDRRPDGELHH